MDWIYKGESFNPLDVSSLYGFIYKITYTYNNKEYTYYGKKRFNSIVSKPQLKSGKKRDNHYFFERKRKNGKIVCIEKIISESDWRTYEGSHNKDSVKDGMVISDKEILYIVSNEPKHKQTLSYLEEMVLFENSVLYDEFNLNLNIGGRYFRGNLIGSKI